MKARGLLKPGAVRRVAIVGPGLDFADKDVGFDIYPQQTLQPFAVLDSLKRLGLAPCQAIRRSCSSTSARGSSITSRRLEHGRQRTLATR